MQLVQLCKKNVPGLATECSLRLCKASDLLAAGIKRSPSGRRITRSGSTPAALRVTGARTEISAILKGRRGGRDGANPSDDQLARGYAVSACDRPFSRHRQPMTSSSSAQNVGTPPGETAVSLEPHGVSGEASFSRMVQPSAPAGVAAGSQVQQVVGKLVVGSGIYGGNSPRWRSISGFTRLPALFPLFPARSTGCA